MSLWQTYRPKTELIEGFQWDGTPKCWRLIKSWAVPIKSTNEHIGRRELEVWDCMLGEWVIARVGDYVLHSLVSATGWWYRVIPQADFEANHETAERPVYLPPGVYA